MRVRNGGNKRHGRRLRASGLAARRRAGTLCAAPARTPGQRDHAVANQTSGSDKSPDGDRREGWARDRTAIAVRGAPPRHDPAGSAWYWSIIKAIAHAVDWRRYMRGIYERGLRNALDIRLERVELAFDHLPEAFDGYTILHLTDPHFDKIDETRERVLALVSGLAVDLCVMTGDYGNTYGGANESVLGPLRDVMAAVTAPDGFLATLGNHDGIRVAEPLAGLGLRVLINESVTLTRGDASIHFTGLDDVHYFYTERARDALMASPDGFKVALVHSPEIADVAAKAGFALYLAGHTHGGQICYPGGRPIIANLRRLRSLAVGLWRYDGMTGYTSRGAGVSVLPVRFNSCGEVTVFTLRRGGAK